MAGDNIGNGDVNPTANYTLPGIMQYLQSQFTQVERNRLQSELERSSLKLKIIELENERNALIRKNEKLQLIVDQLTAGSSLKKNDNNNNDDDNKENINVNMDQFYNIDNDQFNVKKLIQAKKFLTSATNEILYLLKTPTIELDSSQSLTVKNFINRDNNDSVFFNYNNNNNNNINSPNDPTNSPNNNGFINDSNNNNHNDDTIINNNINNELAGPDIERQLNDIISSQNINSNVPESDAETIIDEHEEIIGPVKQKKDEESNDEEEDDEDDDDDDFDDDDFDDDDDDDEDEDDDDDEEFDQDLNVNNKQNHQITNSDISKHGQNEKEKLLKLLKKSPRKPVIPQLPKLSIKLTSDVSEMEIKKGKLFAYYDKLNVVKIYDDLLNKGELIKEIELPNAIDIVDIVTNENYVLIGTSNSLIVYNIQLNEDKGNGKIEINNIKPKSIDLDQNKIIIVTENNIIIYEIETSTNKIKQLIECTTHYEGIIKKIKFIKNNENFSIALLSSTALYLFELNDDGMTIKPFKNIVLENYNEWLLTSKNLILNFSNKLLSLYDFKECSGFKQIPFNSNFTLESIGACVDEDDIFYVSRCSDNSQDKDNKSIDKQKCEILLFKVDEFDGIKEISSITDINFSDRYCVGKINNGFAFFVIKDGNIEVHTI